MVKQQQHFMAVIPAGSYFQQILLIALIKVVVTVCQIIEIVLPIVYVCTYSYI